MEMLWRLLLFFSFWMTTGGSRVLLLRNMSRESPRSPAPTSAADFYLFGLRLPNVGGSVCNLVTMFGKSISIRGELISLAGREERWRA